MIIALSHEQQNRLLEWMKSITKAHVDSDCMPPGYVLEISFDGAFGADACAVSGSSRLQLGEVEVSLSSGNGA